MLHRILSPAVKGAKQGLICEAGQGSCQGCPVVVASGAGFPPGVEGAQQGGVGQLGQGLLKSCPVGHSAVAGCTPCLKDLPYRTKGDKQCPAKIVHKHSQKWMCS